MAGRTLLKLIISVCESCSYSCSACKKPIYDEAIMTGEESYHEDCFKCVDCGKKMDDLVYANTERGLLCLKCSEVSSTPAVQPKQTLLSQNSLTSLSPREISTFNDAPGTVKELQTELQQTRERLNETEKLLEKIKGVSKNALEEFHQVKSFLAKETAAREKAEKIAQALRQEVERKSSTERLMADENMRLREQMKVKVGQVSQTQQMAEVERELTEKLSMIKSEIALSLQKRETLEQTNAELASKKSVLMTELDEMLQRNEAETMKQYAHVSQEETQKLQRQFHEIKATFDAEMEQLKVERSLLQEEVDRLKSDRHRMDKTIDSLARSREELKKDLDVLQAKINSAEAGLNKLESRKQSLANVEATQSTQSVNGTVRVSSAKVQSQPLLLETKGLSMNSLITAPVESPPLPPLPETAPPSVQERNSSVKVAARKSLVVVGEAPVEKTSVKEVSENAKKQSSLFKWISLKTDTKKKKVNDKPHQLASQSFYVAEKCIICAQQIFGVREMLCKACGVACHTACAPAVQATCSGDRSHLRVPLFSNDLAMQCHYEDKTVPIVVTKCIEAVYKRGIEYEGIYRKSGLQSQIRNLIEQFNTSKVFGADLNLLDDNKWPDINVITGVLKQYFRGLPIPLTTFELYAKLVEGFLEADEITRLHTVVNAVASLPVPNFETLRVLMAHLYAVSQKSGSNLMTAKNLAVVFGPNLLRSQASATALKNGELSPDVELSDMGYKNSVVEYMILREPEIFMYAEKMRRGERVIILSSSQEKLPADASTDSGNRRSAVLDTPVGSLMRETLNNNSSYVVVSAENEISQSFAAQSFQAGRGSSLKQLANSDISEEESYVDKYKNFKQSTSTLPNLSAARLPEAKSK